MYEITVEPKSFYLSGIAQRHLIRNFQLELFLLLTYGGWFLLWLVSLGYERAAKTRYLRLCHWALFLTVALLVLLGM